MDTDNQNMGINRDNIKYGLYNIGMYVWWIFKLALIWITKNMDTNMMDIKLDIDMDNI